MEVWCAGSAVAAVPEGCAAFRPVSSDGTKNVRAAVLFHGSVHSMLDWVASETVFCTVLMATLPGLVVEL